MLNGFDVFFLCGPQSQTNFLNWHLVVRTRSSPAVSKWLCNAHKNCPLLEIEPKRNKLFWQPNKENRICLIGLSFSSNFLAPWRSSWKTMLLAVLLDIHETVRGHPAVQCQCSSFQAQRFPVCKWMGVGGSSGASRGVSCQIVLFTA